MSAKCEGEDESEYEVFSVNVSECEVFSVNVSECEV